jgi:hypothetical protein
MMWNISMICCPRGSGGLAACGWDTTTIQSWRGKMGILSRKFIPADAFLYGHSCFYMVYCIAEVNLNGSLTFPRLKLGSSRSASKVSSQVWLLHKLLRCQMAQPRRIHSFRDSLSSGDTGHCFQRFTQSKPGIQGCSEPTDPQFC